MLSQLPSRVAKIVATLLCSTLALVASTHAGGQSMRIGGTGSALGTMRLIAVAYDQQGPKQSGLTVVPNLGSSGAIRALQAGAIDVALISRPLKAEEVAVGLVAFEYGRSPFVFITSKPGIKNITATTVADILSGRNSSWSDGQPVRFVMRPQSDGDNTYLASLSPEIDKALKIAHSRPGMVVAATDQEAADEAQRLPGSLSLNTLALVLSERRKLNVIAFEGAVPSAKALAAGSYPYFKPLLIVTRGAPSGTLLQFVEYLKSPRGREILESNGHFVPN